MHSPSTRQRLINAGVELFAEKGYANTSLSEILGRAAANSGSFYHYFRGKEDLLLTILENYLAEFQSAIAAPAYALTDDPIERVFAILQGYRERLLDSNCTYGCPIGRLALEVDAADRPVHELLDANFRQWVATVAECLRAARFVPESEVDELASLILTIMEGGVMQSRSAGNIAPFDVSVRQLRRYIDLLKTQRPVESPGIETTEKRPRRIS